MAEKKARAPKGGTAVLDKPADAPAAPPADDSGSEATNGTATTALSKSLPKTGDTAPSGQVVVLSTAGAAFTKTQAILPANATYGRAEGAYQFVEQMRESSKWWQGDIINFVRDHHGEKYAQLAAATGQDEGSLRNIASLSGKFAPERRRPELSWGHHQAVQSLPEEVADKLLADAAKEGWNVIQIRAEAREWREEHASADAGGSGGGSSGASKSVVFIGVQPVDESEVPEDQDIYGCQKCGNDLSFAENIMHCLTCGAHYSPDDNEECPYHDAEGNVLPDAPRTEYVTASDTGTETGETGDAPTQPAPASGQVITPADAVPETAVTDLLDLATVRALDVKAVAAELRGNQDALGAAMGLHEWLGRLIEALASKPARTRATKATAAPATEAPPADAKPLDGMAGAPAPKPTGKKRSRGKPAPAADTAPPADPESSTGGDEDIEFD